MLEIENICTLICHENVFVKVGTLNPQKAFFTHMSVRIVVFGFVRSKPVPRLREQVCQNIQDISIGSVNDLQAVVLN